MSLTLEDFVVSPCSNPELPLDIALKRYAALGYRKFELFTSWAKSAAYPAGDPEPVLNLARANGMRFTSMHLPAVNDDIETSLAAAVKAAGFAKRLGVEVVLFKATSRPNYIAAGRRFLDAIAGLGVTPVLQNHTGAAISSLSDFREVIEGIDDPRMKTLLEVGHFHAVGVGWREGWELLRDSVALVHIKDQIGSKPVPFGEGEIDLPALFRHMTSVGYRGNYVVEMEAAMGDTEKTIALLGDARKYMQQAIKEQQ
jgi:sugar phosphate isomerase/epimerase